MFPEAKWKYTELGKTMEAYYETHEWIRLDPEARNKANTKITESDDRNTWTIEQTLVDPDSYNDFQIVFELSIQKAKENGIVKIAPIQIRSIVE